MEEQIAKQRSILSVLLVLIGCIFFVSSIIYANTVSISLTILAPSEGTGSTITGSTTTGSNSKSSSSTEVKNTTESSVTGLNTIYTGYDLGTGDNDSDNVTGKQNIYTGDTLVETSHNAPDSKVGIIENNKNNGSIPDNINQIDEHTSSTETKSEVSKPLTWENFNMANIFEGGYSNNTIPSSIVGIDKKQIETTLLQYNTVVLRSLLPLPLQKFLEMVLYPITGVKPKLPLLDLLFYPIANAFNITRHQIIPGGFRLSLFQLISYPMANAFDPNRFK